MLIEEIRLTNLLSFGPQSEAVKLRPLNIVIGPNGSGKSNLLDALDLLRNVPDKVARPIMEGGGVEEWLWKGEGEGKIRFASLDVVLKIYEAYRLGYSMIFSSIQRKFKMHGEIIEKLVNGKNKLIIDTSEQSTKIKGNKHIISKKHWDVKYDSSVVSQLRDPERYPEFSALSNVLPAITLYRDLGFGRHIPLRMPQRADLPNHVLDAEGRNLGLVLNRLRRDAVTKARLLSALRELYEGIDDYDVLVEGGTVQVFFHEGPMTIPATRLSDGTLRYLCLLAVLCDPKPPPLIAIEEPELGLHPDILPTIARLLREASERCQLIVTTHSEALVDAMTETPEDVLVCEKHEGSSSLRRLSAEELRPWLERYRLGTLWSRGDLGGTRW